MCIGVSAYVQKYQPSAFSAKFLINFQWTPIVFKFFILNFISFFKSLKVTKFLVIISQFKILFVIEKTSFGYELCLSLNISGFDIFFMEKLEPPSKGQQ